MAEPKTRPTRMATRAWLAAIPDAARRKDCATLIAIMKSATGEAPELWGTSIVGFGRYALRYASGKTLDWPLVGFASRKGGLVIYLMSGFARSGALLKALGPHRTGQSCLYVKRLADLNRDALEALVDGAVQAMAARRVSVAPRARPARRPAAK